MKVLVLSLVTNIVVATPYRYAEDAIDAEVNSTSAQEEEKEDEVANHQEVNPSLCRGFYRCCIMLTEWSFCRYWMHRQREQMICEL